MAIDLDLPEPDQKACIICRRTDHLQGTLIHWPNAACMKASFTLPGGTMIEPFSLWFYGAYSPSGGACRKTVRRTS